MKNLLINKFLLCVAMVSLFFFSAVFADTLVYKDGTEEKGLIVEKFTDRLVFSSIDGEREVMLSRVKAVIYDDEERRLLQLGKNLIRREEYVNAYRTFEEVIELDPDNEEARERMAHLRIYLESATYGTIKDKVASDSEYFEGKVPENPQEVVEQKLGIILEKEGNYIFVKEADEFGENCGFKKDDRIISVWGENAIFSDLPEVARLLLSSREVLVDVERRISVKFEDKNWFLRAFGGYNMIIGATLKRDKSGITVRKVVGGGPFKKYGIIEGDIVIGMDGMVFEYMPFKNVISLIIRNHGRKVEMIIHRKLNFWGRG